MSSIVGFMIITLITLLAFWQGQKYLYLWFLACVADTYFGFTWAATGSAGSAVWAEGLAMVVLGGYCLIIVLMTLWRGGKK